MAKRHRIAFTTLHTAPSTSFRPSGRDGEDKPQGSLPAGATVRISVPLFQSNDQRYPEFYYPDLVESCQQGREVGPWEDKGGKRCRKDRIQDLIDMGYGYDESDSFIDNSEVYTEFVPASLDTKYGGFYINMGVLEYQQVFESEENYVKEKCPQVSKAAF